MPTITLPTIAAQVHGFTTQIPARELGGLVYLEFFRNHHGFISSGVDILATLCNDLLEAFEQYCETY